jgi:hypothetical protein
VDDFGGERGLDGGDWRQGQGISTGGMAVETADMMRVLVVYGVRVKFR